MKKYIALICAVIPWLCGCTCDAGDPAAAGGSFTLAVGQCAMARAVDEDNLASEQVINTIAVFFTDPSSDAVTHAYIDAGFSSSGDYKIVTLPLDPADLGTKDIYVVTNYAAGSLDAVGTITALKEVRTPIVDKDTNLEAGMGFCMYGSLAGFDLGSGQQAVVEVVRTCAKIRVSLFFPQGTDISSDNSMVVARAANYTFLSADAVTTVPSSAYFNFAQAEPLVRTSSGSYTATVYVYEADQAPQLYLYTHMDEGLQEFTAALPVPERNHLYELEVLVYDGTAAFGLGEEPDPGYRCRTSLSSYDGSGRQLTVEGNMP